MQYDLMFGVGSITKCKIEDYIRQMIEYFVKAGACKCFLCWETRFKFSWKDEVILNERIKKYI